MERIAVLSLISESNFLQVLGKSLFYILLISFELCHFEDFPCEALKLFAPPRFFILSNLFCEIEIELGGGTFDNLRLKHLAAVMIVSRPRKM